MIKQLIEERKESRNIGGLWVSTLSERSMREISQKTGLYDRRLFDLTLLSAGVYPEHLVAPGLRLGGIPALLAVINAQIGVVEIDPLSEMIVTEAARIPMGRMMVFDNSEERCRNLSRRVREIYGGVEWSSVHTALRQQNVDLLIPPTVRMIIATTLDPQLHFLVREYGRAKGIPVLFASVNDHDAMMVTLFPDDPDISPVIEGLSRRGGEPSDPQRAYVAQAVVREVAKVVLSGQTDLRKQMVSFDFTRSLTTMTRMQ